MESKKNDNKKEKKKEDERAIVCPVSLRNVDGLFFVVVVVVVVASMEIDGNRDVTEFFFFLKKNVFLSTPPNRFVRVGPTRLPGCTEFIYIFF